MSVDRSILLIQLTLNETGSHEKHYHGLFPSWLRTAVIPLQHDEQDGSLWRAIQNLVDASCLQDTYYTVAKYSPCRIVSARKAHAKIHLHTYILRTCQNK